MRKVKAIKFVYENCDVTEFNPGDFKALELNSITSCKWINCFQYRDGEEITNIKCGYFRIKLTNKAINRQTNAGCNTLEHITIWKDLVSVVIVYDDGGDESIDVPYHTKTLNINDETNLWQKNRVDGNCIIIECCKRNDEKRTEKGN
jgi:hypothetical protein